MRLAFIMMLQETNDFNPTPTRLDDFRSYGILEGQEMIETLRGSGQFGGYLKAVEESGLEIETIPILRAFSVAGGRITREAFDFFQHKIRAGLEAAGPIDGLALQLHGACAAEGVDDVEGAQAALCREILGPGIPIVLGLDHHANLTQKIVESVDAIVGHRTQPHDLVDTGYVATKLLLRHISEKLTPVMAWRKIPLLSHQEQFLTSKGPMKRWFDRAREMEKDPMVLQAASFPMQPWLDVTEGGWACVVTTNGDRAKAETLVDELADLAWSMRADFQVKDALPIDEAILKADAYEKGVVVLSDTGDTVFGGAAGDSNLILEAMLRLKIKGPALVPMISVPAVEKLHAAGEGATVTLELGGHVATEFFKPLTVKGIVRKLGSGPVSVPQYMHQPIVDMGRVAIFEVGPVTMLITEKRGVAGNVPGAYEAFGVDVARAKMVVLKTASNFQFYDGVASGLIRVDTTGPGQSDVMTLPWKRIPRPIYPLDPITDRHVKTASRAKV